MFKNMNIKSQVVAVIAVILSICLVLQIILYFVLQSQTRKNVTTIFDSITKNAEAQIQNLNDQITEICSLLSTHSITQSYLYEYEPAEIVRGLDRANELMSDYRARNQNIACLAIIKNNKYFLSSEVHEFPFSQLDTLIEQYIVPAGTERVFTPSFIAGDKTYFAYILPIYPSDINHYTQEATANYIICIYEMKTINYSPYSFVDSRKISMIITDEDNRILLSSNITEHGQPLTNQTNKKNYLSNTFVLENTGWNVTIFMPRKDIQANSDISLLLYVLSMLTFNIIMLLLLIQVLNGTFIKRVTLLQNTIQKIPSDCTNYYVTYPHNDEFSEIVTVINQIIQKISSLNREKIAALNRLYEAELLQKETRIFYLYGQMSPHFLYNSMTCIQGMALKYNAKDIVQVVTSLSQVFRYFSNNLNISTIKQDMHFAVEYFKILNIRRKTPIELSLNIDNSLQGIPCLKMIYQPILENTLRHAFGPLDAGNVIISSISDEQYAIIEITDDGRGIDSIILNHLNHKLSNTSLQKIHNSDHVGLINVHMRLKLYYGAESGIKILSSSGKGTTVRITFKKVLDNNAAFSLE